MCLIDCSLLNIQLQIFHSYTGPDGLWQTAYFRILWMRILLKLDKQLFKQIFLIIWFYMEYTRGKIVIAKYFSTLTWIEHWFFFCNCLEFFISTKKHTITLVHPKNISATLLLNDSVISEKMKNVWNINDGRHSRKY